VAQQPQSVDVPPGMPARCLGTDGHEIRLRYRTMRRLHNSTGRSGRPVLRAFRFRRSTTTRSSPWIGWTPTRV